MILVLEKCKVNLKTHIFDHEELVPASSRSPEAFKKVCQWVKELTDALAYIHEQGIVHSDLKLENILVRRKVVSVCSFCTWLNRGFRQTIDTKSFVNYVKIVTS